MSLSWFQFIRGLLGYSDDDELWKPEDWYPQLCPPKIPKDELLRDVDFTLVDGATKMKPGLPKESFDQLVKHLTSDLNSDLHKLRSIFVWMGEQKVGCQQETRRCENNDSPINYLQQANKDATFISKMFAKMCRCARIPCILVKGKAKGASYDPDDEYIRGENTWAVVHVSGSWRFVFPHWAFVKLSGYQKGNWMRVEDSEKTARERFTANNGKQVSDFDEFYFLTDPKMMNYLCHPYDKEKQLMAEPWTKEKFFASPFFRSPYFSSGWSLIDPMSCVIKPTEGWCFVNICSPGTGSKIKYQLFYDEIHSRRSFPQKIQIERYVTILKRTKQSKSIMVRLPEIGTYKLEVSDCFYRLLEFRIVCNYVTPDIWPLPPCSKNGFGYDEEAAAAAGFSKPSHTEGVVPVNSGEEIDFSFTIEDGVDILARLVHCTRTTDNLHDNVSVRREKEKAIITARLPADDPKPEYAIQIDSNKNIRGTESSIKTFTTIFSYLLTSNKSLSAAIVDKDKQELLQCYEEFYATVAKDDARLLEQIAFRVKMAGIEDPILNDKIQEQKAKFKRMRKEVLAAAEERNLDRLSLALRHCMAVNLEYRGDVEDTKKVLLELCKKEVKQALKSLKARELHDCLDKAANTCIGESVREQAWFRKAQEAHQKLQGLQRRRQNLESLRDEDRANMTKPPDYVIDVIFATFILLGESQTELNTWQNIRNKLRQTGEEELFTRAISFDDTLLTQGRVDLAAETLRRWKPGDEDVIKRLHLWCLERIEIYRLSTEITIN